MRRFANLLHEPAGSEPTRLQPTCEAFPSFGDSVHNISSTHRLIWRFRFIIYLKHVRSSGDFGSSHILSRTRLSGAGVQAAIDCGLTALEASTLRLWRLYFEQGGPSPSRQIRRSFVFRTRTKTRGHKKFLQQLSSAVAQLCGRGEDSSLLLEGQAMRRNFRTEFGKMPRISDVGRGINNIPMRHMVNLGFDVSASPNLLPSSSKCSKLPIKCPTLQPLCNNRLLSRSRRTPVTSPWCPASFRLQTPGMREQCSADSVLSSSAALTSGFLEISMSGLRGLWPAASQTAQVRKLGVAQADRSLDSEAF